MDWREALEVVVARTKHEPFRRACADDHPQRETWRARMIEMATGAPPAYPPILAMAGTGIAAAGRAAAAFVRREPVFVLEPEYERRLAICRSCEHFDAAQARCRLCGCYARVKLSLLAERCPLDPPKWGGVTGPS